MRTSKHGHEGHVDQSRKVDAMTVKFVLKSRSALLANMA